MGSKETNATSGQYLINFLLQLCLACAPALARTFLINVKPTKKSKLVKDDDKDNRATIAASSPVAQASKYRIERPSAAVVAFAHRLGLDQLKDQTLVMRIVTHGSYERVGIQTNEKLDYLGKLASVRDTVETASNLTDNRII